MSVDPYALCPCLSGKKLKFCCIDIANEMEKAIQLQQGHQYKAALKALDKLESKYPNRLWVQTNRAALLINLERHEETREILKAVLKENPGHHPTAILDALAAFYIGGYETAKRPLHKAIQATVKAKVVSELLIELLTMIVYDLFQNQKYMAARQHLALSMRLGSEENQQDIFNRLLEFDSNLRIPHPFRGVHALPEVKVDGDDLNKSLKKAMQLHSIGCWEETAKVLNKIVATDKENASVWHTMGLMHGWDGNEVEAAKAFHQASELYKQSDRDLAIELETLSQVLTLNQDEKKIPHETRSFKVEKASQFLTELEDNSRLILIENNSQREQQEPTMCILYEEDRADDWKRAVPAPHLGVVHFQQNSKEWDNSPNIYLISKKDNIEKASQLLLDSVGDMISENPEEPAQNAYDFPPLEFLPLAADRIFPQEIPAQVEQEFRQSKWKTFSEETWLNTALESLNGKTPLEAKGDSESEISLIASVLIFDIFADFCKYSLDIDSVWKTLDLEPPSVFAVDEKTELNSLSYAQLKRMTPSELSDDQIQHVLTRSLLMRHSRFLNSVLNEVLTREALMPKIDLNRVYMTLSELAEQNFKPEEALEWAEKGLQHAREEDDTIMNLLPWELRELRLLSRNPEDPVFLEALGRMDRAYSKKIPSFEEMLQGIAEQYDIEIPGKDALESSSILTSATSGTPPTESGKLWLPGQE